MEPRDIFKNLSPLDHRYFQSNRELFEHLSYHLSEEAVVRTCVRAEVALLRAHLSIRDGQAVGPAAQKRGVDRPGAEQPNGGARAAGNTPAGAVDAVEAQVSPEEVYAEEEKTQHNIRALVNVLKRKVPENIRHFVHLGATSVDILDTAASLRVRGAVREVVLPLLAEVEETLCDIAAAESATVQVGRTHGQFAVPITFGFAVAEYVSRLGKSISEIETRSADLRGKLAGAVGAYNAIRMVTDDPAELERRYLAFLGLKPSEHSTQLVEPEYLLRLLLELNVAFGILANLADDLRNLQRSEIDEVREMFTSTQVGSSTMPQKRNPWNSEHVKSLWKAFAPRVVTFYMDQISEHQRDLTNSASSRFVADYIAGFAAAANRMLKVLKSLHVDRERMAATVASAGSVFAEPAYILLALSGESEAHEIIRQVTLESESGKVTFLEALQSRPETWRRIEGQLGRVGQNDAPAFFRDPARYSGIARRRAEELATKYREQMKLVRGKCNES